MVWTRYLRSVFGDGYSELYVPSQLPAELAEMIVHGLAPMTAAGFLRNLTEAVIDDVRTHIVGVERLRVVTHDETLDPVAFLASRMVHASIYHPNDIHMYHLGGIIVDPSTQHRGIGRKLLEDETRRTGSTALGFHTQNLHMLALGSMLTEYDFSLASSLAPDMGTADPSYVILGERPSVVHVGRYNGQSLYGDSEAFRQQGSLIRGLNTQNGDAVVYVGRIV